MDKSSQNPFTSTQKSNIPMVGGKEAGTGRMRYFEIPSYEEETKKIQELQVMLTFSLDNKQRAFAGPLTLDMDLGKMENFFPYQAHERPLVHEEKI